MENDKGTAWKVSGGNPSIQQAAIALHFNLLNFRAREKPKLSNSIFSSKFLVGQENTLPRA